MQSETFVRPENIFGLREGALHILFFLAPQSKPAQTIMPKSSIWYDSHM